MSIADAFSRTFPAPRWWREFDASQRLLASALILSAVAHVGVLAVKFAPPQAMRLSPIENKLDVILVNARHVETPVVAQALAQANLDGGGEAATGRAKSFLPTSRQVRDGDELREAATRVQRLEQEQKQLLTTLLAANTTIAATEAKPDVEPEPSRQPPQVTGAQLYASAPAILRREAEINKRIEDENARPKRKQVTPSTREVEYAMYFKQWADKVERLGNNNYPEAAKGRRFRLVMTASIFADGRIEKIEIDRPSGHPDVDAAAVRIVRLAGPYGRFSDAMRAKYGVLDLTMTWTFAREEALSVEGSN